MAVLRPILLTLLSLSLLGLAGCQTLPSQKTAKTDTPPQASLLEETLESPLPAPAIEKPTLVTEATQEAAEPVAAPSVAPAVEEPPLPPATLWERLQAGFSLDIPSNSRVDREFEWFTKHPEYMGRVQERAEPYLHFIVEEVEKRGMPGELALLPVVESAFQPFAYSHGRAAGLWQFIPSTGSLYGLKQNWWYDGRRDVVAATQAALDYLQALSERFSGDWELALAAYNAGAGNVQKAIRKNMRRGKPTDFWSLDLPRETRSYVPRLLAVAKLMRDPEAHGLTLRPIPNEPHFANVDIRAQLDLALAAEMAGMTIDELYLLNPAFNRWATDPEGPHRLLIPVDKAAAFEQKLATLEPSQRLSWTRYEIRRGDNLGAIARKFNTTVALLQEINKLRGVNIRAGNHLLIPASSKALSHYSLSEEQRIAKIQNESGKGSRIVYEVQPGDTLWDIARSHKVDHRKLASWNGIAPTDLLHPGQDLVIWKSTPATKTSQVATGLMHASLTTGPKNTRNVLSYQVRKGDSLYRIAQRFNVSVADLKQWNSLPGKYLQPGQKLKLHVDITNQAL